MGPLTPRPSIHGLLQSVTRVDTKCGSFRCDGRSVRQFFFLIKCDKCLQRENVITECDRKYLEVRPRLTASRPLSIKTVSNDHKRTRVIVICLETLVLSLFLYTL